MASKDAAAADATKPKNWLHKFWLEWVKPFLIIALVLGSLRSALADWNDVPTGSMKPTILEGDRVFVNKLAYDLKFPFTRFHLAQWDDPLRGDIIVFFSPFDGKRLVKRVVGMPGDILQINGGRVFVNGAEAVYEPISRSGAEVKEDEELQEALWLEETIGDRKHPILLSPRATGARDFGPIVIPPGQYFALGDNRDNSFDSRYFGLVDRERIVGRAVAVVLSVDRNDYYLPRWERFLKKLM